MRLAEQLDQESHVGRKLRASVPERKFGECSGCSENRSFQLLRPAEGERLRIEEEGLVHTVGLRAVHIAHAGQRLVPAVADRTDTDHQAAAHTDQAADRAEGLLEVRSPLVFVRRR